MPIVIFLNKFPSFTYSPWYFSPKLVFTKGLTNIFCLWVLVKNCANRVGNLWIPSRNNCAGLTAKNDTANFWDTDLMGTVFQWVRSPLTGSNRSKKGEGLGLKAGETKLPAAVFQIVFNRAFKIRTSVVMIENNCIVS